MTEVVLRYQENGMIIQWYREIYRDKIWNYQKRLFEVHDTISLEPRKLTMHKVSGAILIILTGLFLSLLVFLSELAFKNKTTNK